MKNIVIILIIIFLHSCGDSLPPYEDYKGTTATSGGGTTTETTEITYAVSGKITAQVGANIADVPNATVIVASNAAGGGSYQATSDAAGNWSVSVPNGSYSVSVSATGYGGFTAKSVTVTGAAISGVNFSGASTTIPTTGFSVSWATNVLTVSGATAGQTVTVSWTDANGNARSRGTTANSSGVAVIDFSSHAAAGVGITSGMSYSVNGQLFTRSGTLNHASVVSYAVALSAANQINGVSASQVVTLYDGASSPISGATWTVSPSGHVTVTAGAATGTYVITAVSATSAGTVTFSAGGGSVTLTGVVLP